MIDNLTGYPWIDDLVVYGCIVLVFIYLAAKIFFHVKFRHHKNIVNHTRDLSRENGNNW